MRKIILLIALVGTISISAFATGGIPFDYTYPFGGLVIRVCGTFTSWDRETGWHGVRTITVTDGNGRVLGSWDEPFSGNAGSGQLNGQYPEVEQHFLEDISHIEP